MLVKTASIAHGATAKCKCLKESCALSNVVLNGSVYLYIYNYFLLF